MRHLFTYITSMAFIFTMLACSDNEEFTADKSATLTFSTDTLSFDTLFNTVTSRTKRLIVYNHNSKGVHLANVSLEQGSNSLYRMNVDGQFGSSINNVEILGKDSIHIFVEVTTPESNPTGTSEEYLIKKITDKIVFTMESGIRQKVVLDTYGMSCTFLHHETISTDTTLSPALPYVIYDSLVVAENATLTIPAGTSLYFHNGASLIVHGKLNAEGTADKNVMMRGDRLDRMFSYLPYDRLDAQWGGVLLTSSCQGCNLTHTDIHSGAFGILCDSIAGTLNMESTTVHNVAFDALSIRHSKAIITNCQITNAAGDCINLENAQLECYHSTIAQFYPWSADRGNALMVTQTLMEEASITPSVNFYNCIITGKARDEVYAKFDSQNDELHLHFYNSLVNTDVSDPQYFTDCIDDDNSHDAAKEDGSEKRTTREKHFRTIDTDNYFYDFRLDSLSNARGKASSAYSSLYPTDKDGIVRPSAHADLGCYQSQYK